MRGALVKWRWAKTGQRKSRRAMLSGNIETRSLATLELKQRCSNVIARARFVIEFWRTKKCARGYRSKDVSGATPFRRDNEKHCRVVGTFADDCIVRLVANSLDSATGKFIAADCRARSI